MGCFIDYHLKGWMSFKMGINIGKVLLDLG